MSDAEPPAGPTGEPARAPAIRASDAERDQVTTILRDAAAQGRLTLEELADRLDRALSAGTRAELEPLTADLPAPAPDTQPRAPATRRGARWVFGILGGDDRKGRWRIAPRCNVVNVMGGCDLDLREALVEGPETEIRVWSVMGGSDIVVPEGVEVELGGFAFMGGNGLKVEGPPPPPGAPRVRVRAFSLMGGTDVKTASARDAGRRLGSG
jgi:hypothetical protein